MSAFLYYDVVNTIQIFPPNALWIIACGMFLCVQLCLVLIFDSFSTAKTAFMELRRLLSVTPALLSVQFARHYIVRKLGKGLEIERTHKRSGSFERRSGNAIYLSLGKTLYT